MTDLFMILSLVAILVSKMVVNFQQQKKQIQFDKLEKHRREFDEENRKLDEMYLLQEEMEKVAERRTQLKKELKKVTHPKCSFCSSRHCGFDHMGNVDWGPYPAKALKSRK